MKIILEHEGDNIKRVEIVTDAVFIHEVMNEIGSALISFGFHPETVEDGFLGKAEQIEQNKEGEK